MQRSRPWSECYHPSDQREREPRTRAHDESSQHLALVSIVIGIARDRERPGLTHIEPQPREEEAARQVLRQHDRRRGQRDAAQEGPLAK
jgi:hypothetical protein